MLDNFSELIDIQTLITRFVAYLPNLLSAIILIFVFVVVNKVIQRMLGATFKRMQMAKQVRGLLLKAVKVAVYIFAILTIADQLKINVTSLIAGVGVMGLALSFAAQDTISNLISGIALIIDKPFQEDDWISIGGMHASVTEIGLRTTVLTTFDNETVVVPNKQLAQERVVNYSMTPKARVRISVGIAYKEDIRQARIVMLETLKRDDRILPCPEPLVLVMGLGDSSVNLEMRFWIEDPMQKYGFMFEYTEKCKYALDNAGIEIPFPHMQLFVEKSEGLKMLSSRGKVKNM
jgi:small-conductance mechanosensitive channel